MSSLLEKTVKSSTNQKTKVAGKVVKYQQCARIERLRSPLLRVINVGNLTLQSCAVRLLVAYTVEPRYSDPRYNDIPCITMNILCPYKSYIKMCGTEPRYNDLRYNDIPDITMRIQQTEGAL